jgi:hypothetical protein
VTSPRRHLLLTIRNLTPRNTDRMSHNERDYSEENRFRRTARRSIREKDSDQRKVEEKLDHPPLVPRISPHLLCEGTQVGVRSRSTVLCDNRGDLSLANSCRRRRITRIFPARSELIARVLAASDAGVNPIFQHWQRFKDNAFPHGFSRHRENLDSKLIVFSMLTLCKKMLEQQTIGKLNANFCLKGCQTS